MSWIMSYDSIQYTDIGYLSNIVKTIAETTKQTLLKERCHVLLRGRYISLLVKNLEDKAHDFIWPRKVPKARIEMLKSLKTVLQELTSHSSSGAQVVFSSSCICCSS